jgi:DNA polymerase I-like protein with 3'-5' exonuclease and polymerase domains
MRRKSQHGSKEYKGTKAHILSKVPMELLERLPSFLLNPDPLIYMSDNFVVFDLETNVKGDNGSPMPCWKQNKIVCGSWSAGPTGAAHNIYGNELKQDRLVDALEKADFVIAHNGKFDIGWMLRAGIDPYKIILYDTMIAEYVLLGNTAMGHLALDKLSQKYLGYNKEAYINLCMKGGVDPEDMIRSKLIQRCNTDILMTRDIFLLQREIVANKGLLGCVFTRSLLSMPLADMEHNGLCLDEEVVEDLYHERAAKLAEATVELDLFTGGINPRSPKQVKEFVYEVLKFKPKMKGYGKNKVPIYSTKSDDLMQLKATNKRQKEFVRLKKLYSTYNADVGKSLLFFHGVVTDPKAKDCTFYAQFNQCITKTHRLSSTGIPRTFDHIFSDAGKPITKSVQFQNLKREFKRVIRARRKGWQMGEADGSQLEFRVAAFLGQCPIATQAIVNNLDVHADTLKCLADNGQGIPWKDMSKDEWKAARQAAKPHTFKPLFGGQSGTDAEVAYYDWFKEHYSGIADAQQKWIDEALTRKRVTVVHGFRFFFPHCKMSNSGYVSNTTNIKNYPVQHFATAEIIPIAIVYQWHLMRQMKSFLVNTVHDSVISELHPEEHQEFRDVSLHAFTYLCYHYLKEVYDVEFNVPLGIGVKIGDNWGTGKELKCVPLPPYKMEGIDYAELITEWIDG